MPAYLIAPSGHCCELPPHPAVLGSDPNCDVPLVGQSVSTRHCELRHSPYGMEVIRLDPTATLLVNGAPVKATMAKDGDIISIGTLRLQLRLPPPAAGTVGAIAEEDNMEGLSEAAKAKRRTQKLMEENWQRTLERYEEIRQRQSLPRALLGALFGTVVAAIGFNIVSTTSWRAYVFLIFAVGLVVGWIIRLTGRGVDRRFGWLGAFTAILGVIGSAAFDSATKLTSGTEVEEEAYAFETPEQTATRKARAAQTKRENEQRAALIAAEAADMDKRGRRKLADDDPFNILDSKRNEDLRFRDEIIAKDSAPTASDLFAIFLLKLFGPKHLVAYLLAGIAAYRSSFRFLSNVEASNLHGASPAMPDELRRKSLRDRIELR